MAPNYFDIHTHLNFATFKDRREEIATETIEGGVWMINVGTTLFTSTAAVELAEKFEEGVYAAIGLHPIHTSEGMNDEEEVPADVREENRIFDPARFKELCRSEKVVAVGECGLDYFHKTTEEEKRLEREAFVAQIEFANEIGKPLMLHVRNGDGGNAYRDAIDILKSHATVPGNTHFFSGTLEDARDLLSIGFSISFTGVVTLTGAYNEAVRYVPLDMIMSETDAPYVAPQSKRGRENRPLYVTEIADRIAHLRPETDEEVRTALVENARRIFSINT